LLEVDRRGKAERFRVEGVLVGVVEERSEGFEGEFGVVERPRGLGGAESYFPVVREGTEGGFEVLGGFFEVGVPLRLKGKAAERLPISEVGERIVRARLDAPREKEEGVVQKAAFLRLVEPLADAFRRESRGGKLFSDAFRPRLPRVNRHRHDDKDQHPQKRTSHRSSSFVGGQGKAILGYLL